jgi:hypothetical protein
MTMHRAAQRATLSLAIRSDPIRFRIPLFVRFFGFQQIPDNGQCRCFHRSRFTFFRNGIEWWRLRREFQKVLSKPQNIVGYLEDTDLVVQEFVRLCSREKPSADLLPLLSRLFLERKILHTLASNFLRNPRVVSIRSNSSLSLPATLSYALQFSVTCLVAFDVRMQSLSKEERRLDSQTSRLIEAAYTTNDVLLRLDNGPRLWRFFETPLYRKLREAVRVCVCVYMMHCSSFLVPLLSLV